MDSRSSSNSFETMATRCQTLETILFHPTDLTSEKSRASWPQRRNSGMEDHLESVHTLTSRFEADLLMDALERDGIPALLRSFEETPYDGLFVMQRGWGRILVSTTHAQAAKEIIEPLVRDLQAKKLYEDPAELDPLLWEKLRNADPQVIGRNAQIRYDAATRAYRVPILHGDFMCVPEEERIFSDETRTDIRENFQLYLVVLHYLLEAQPSGIVGQWVSEQEIPGGSFFFHGVHAFHTKPLEELFGHRPALFASAAERLGGMRVAGGDLAYRFWALPRVPLTFILWKGDEEFPATVHVRFDASIPHHFHTLDTIWALVNTVCRTLLAIGRDKVSSEQ
ncbi:MAG TPA: hypothetical protein DCZ69_18205 [Syntrophobacteraceae bacterium]|nr:hypothetical protein [Syntrophobacteraceae bacterium]